MSAERHARIGRLFAGAVARPAPERAAFVRDAAGPDAALAGEVLALLAADAADDPALEPGAGIGTAAAAAVAAMPAASAAADEPPDRVGRYEILRTIGAGGMGVVYEARQVSPRRHVALKVIRHGMLSPTLLARFRVEAQVLGRLQHPGIAQIHEAGTAGAEDGRGPGTPFVAMELVDGPPLVAYARARGLDVRARLELVADLADAVHHAHTKGVVHRDLKPGNVLVTEDARGRPQPKILDFGIARATDADVHTVTLRTDVGQLLGTVPYMSPEQASGDPTSIDARCDVYALGVIAYELLAGRLPLPVEGLMIHEAVRVIREDEPTRLGLVDRSLRGDVETIVARAMEKDPERRYRSADAFAEDIRRHLDDRPIVARPTSSMEQLRRLTRRHRPLVVGTAMVMLTLLVGAAVAGRYAVIAGRTAAKLIEREAATRRSAAAASMAAAAAAIREGDFPAAERQLASVDDEHRAWEWRHLDAQLARHRETWRAPATPIVGRPVVPPDGRTMLAVLEDGSIGRWEVATGAAMTPIELGAGFDPPRDLDEIPGEPDRTGGRAAPATVLLAPAGDRVAARRSDGALVVRGLAGAPDEVVVPGTGDRPRPVAWDAAGERLLLVDADGTATWDGSTVVRLDVASPRVAAFLADGSLVVGRRAPGIHRLDPADGRRLAEHRLFGDEMTAIAQSPDGSRIAVGCTYRTLLILDARTLALVARLDGHRTAITSLDFTPDGRGLLSASRDGAMRRWSTDDWSPDWNGVATEPDAFTLPLPGREDDLLVAGSAVRVHGTEPGSGRRLDGHEGYAYYVAFSPDNRLVASSALGDSTVLVRRTADGSAVAAFEAPGRGWYIYAVPCVQFSADGTAVVALQNRLGWRHDLATGATETVDPGDDWLVAFDRLRGERRATRFAHGATWSPDGTVRALASASRGVIIVRIDDEDRTYEIPGATGTSGVAFSPDSRRLAWTGRDGRVHVSDVDTGAVLRTLEAHVGQAYAVAWHPTEPRLATGGEDAVIRIWDTETGSLRLEIREHDMYVRWLEFSPDGTMLASASGDATVRLWDTLTREERLAAGAVRRPVPPAGPRTD